MTTQSPHQSLRARTKTQYDKNSEVKRVQLNLNENQAFVTDQTRKRECRSPLVVAFTRETMSGKNAYMKPPTAGLPSRNAGVTLPKGTETVEIVSLKHLISDSKSPTNPLSNHKQVRKMSSGKTPFAIRQPFING
jgi:hypothetical protein